ncbi:hypothetical protein FTO74_16375 [Granulicella sp. WH15]|nr:hypothetical protein FTO74_16375 [Granulicella sp. WH15]
MAITFLVTPIPGYPQSQTERPGLMKGKPVESPEKMSGVWESSDGSQGIVGLHFLLTTKVAGAPTTLAGIPQTEEHLMIGVYQRTSLQLRQGDHNYFMDTPDSGVSWDGKRLVLEWTPRVAGDPAIDLDLIYDKHQEIWSGRFHRGEFSGHVMLRRPTVRGNGAASSLTGTWVSNRPGMNGCVHIVQGSDGTLMGWSDDLQLSGRYRYANGLKPPEQTFEQYGDLVKAEQTGKNSFSIEFKAYTAMCCSRTYIGILSDDGLTLNGGWQAGPNQTPINLAWRKVRGDSCVGQAF